MKRMKKVLIGMSVVIAFTMLTLTPASAFRGHRYYSGSRAYWGGALFGLGILTAAVVTNSLLNPPEPRVVYRPAPRVVYQPTPVVTLPPKTVFAQEIPAPVTQAQLQATGKATVTAALLNVRSGPGTNFSVLCQVPRGAVLDVHGNAPGWYYVQIPNGDYGWVMIQFAAPGSLPADG